MLAQVIERYDIPTQSCVLAHVTTSMELMRRGAPVDLVFQSIAGTQAANLSFGIDLNLLREAKALRANLPVALASGYVTPEIEERALQGGANALIYKPNDVNELCETVQRLIHGADAD